MNTKIVPTVKGILSLKRPQFVSLVYLSKTDKSVSRYTVNLGFSYLNLLRKSITELEILLSEITDKISLEFQAATEVMASLQESLSKHLQGEQSDNYTKKGQYLSLGNGVNLNTVDDSIQLFGLIQSKVVLVKGEPRKKVNSKPLTIAKNKVRKQLSISKFREFALDDGNVDTVKMNGETLEITPNLLLFKDLGIELNPITFEPITVPSDGDITASILVMGNNPMVTR